MNSNNAITRRDPLVALTTQQLGDGVRSLLLFGSHLSADASHRGVPDLLAVVENGSLSPMLRRLGCGPLVRRLAPHLPPITLALADGGEIRAKLNLLESDVATRELARLPDLYLAGRLSKRTQLLYARDKNCQDELDAMCERAAKQVARLIVCDLPRSCSIEDAARACIAISYRAEVRPEGPTKLRALYDSFGDYYARRFTPLLLAAATKRGIRTDVAAAMLIDDRDDDTRKRNRAQLMAFLRRCRLRAVLRWPKQMLCYRGWLTYVVEKRRRAHVQESRS